MSLIEDISALAEDYKENDDHACRTSKRIDEIIENPDNKCTLLKDGICVYVTGEDVDCYDKVDNCPVEAAGLWWCGEIGDLVNKAGCKDCNLDQDCGCCDYVHSGSAIYTCEDCGQKKVKTVHGWICLDPKLTPEEVAAEVERCNENPGEFFRC